MGGGGDFGSGSGSKFNCAARVGSGRVGSGQTISGTGRDRASVLSPCRPLLQMGVGISFHQPGTVNENVLESDFEPLCDGTMRRCLLADLRLLEGM